MYSGRWSRWVWESGRAAGTVTQKVAEAPAKQDFKAVTTVKSGQKNVYAVVQAMNGNYWKKVIAGMKKAGEREWGQCLCRRRE